MVRRSKDRSGAVSLGRVRRGVAGQGRQDYAPAQDDRMQVGERNERNRRVGAFTF